MSEEDRQRELKWEREKIDALERFVNRVLSAVRLGGDPIKRKALYDSWRKEYGDDRARSTAIYAEQALKGEADFGQLQATLSQYIKVRDKM